MKDMSIGIVGGGVVGQATARCYLEHVKQVMIYDVIPERSTHHLHEVLCDTDLVFVCLPTPQVEGSMQCDVSVIEGFFQHCAGMLHNRHYVLRSTVPIGTTRRLREKYRLSNLVHSPEFLTARCAMVDVQIPSRNIVGGLGGSITNACECCLVDLYEQRFPHVPLIWTSSDESEAIKLFTNGFFSVKVAFFNEMCLLSDKLGLDWDTVIGGILADGRISPSHTLVPGPDGSYGFGGACLVKDLCNLITCIQDARQYPVVTAAAWEANKHHRMTRIEQGNIPNT